eukprot:2405667-Amphidinium_carterae.1
MTLDPPEAWVPAMGFADVALAEHELETQAGEEEKEGEEDTNKCGKKAHADPDVIDSSDLKRQ